MAARKTELLTVDEAGAAMEVSRATVWRLIRRGAVASVRVRGRRLIPREALSRSTALRRPTAVPPLSEDHPIFRLVGAGRGGGRPPGARQKHEVAAKR